MKNKCNLFKAMMLALVVVLPQLSLGQTVVSRWSPGDINSDKRFDIDDVTLLIRHILGEEEQVQVQDPRVYNVAHHDTIVDITDLNDLIKKILNGGGEPIYPDYVAPENCVTYMVGGVPFYMVPVEAGTFIMGGNGRFNTPRHEVTLTKDYYMGLTEVTLGMWKAVMGSFDNTSAHLLFHDDQPIVYVSWNDCQEFISRLNEMTGLTFRLPTEAEWEFAGRGGNLSHVNNNDSTDVVWDNNTIPYDYITPPPVGMFKPNQLGLYDMGSGNAQEFCQDDLYYYTDEPQVDPVNITAEPRQKMIRGGVVYSTGDVVTRNYLWSDDRSPYVGLRLAMSM